MAESPTQARRIHNGVLRGIGNGMRGQGARDMGGLPRQGREGTCFQGSAYVAFSEWGHGQLAKEGEEGTLFWESVYLAISGNKCILSASPPAGPLGTPL